MAKNTALSAAPTVYTRNQTIFRWAGSKKQLVPILSRYWEQSGKKRYVEPFAGSACLFFHLQPEKALIADINKELITTYKQIKKDWKNVFENLKKIKVNKGEYYRIRGIDPKTVSDPGLRAAYFIYLNRFCFNGLYRTNNSGQFNVPYGSKGSIPPEEIFTKTSKSLKRARLISSDFEKTLKLVKKDDFVYMDPPFSVYNKNVFTEYDTSKFDINKINILRKWLIELDKKKISFLVSYLESEEADLLAEGFYKHSVNVRRSIAGFSSNRRTSNEVLISNFSIPEI